MDKITVDLELLKKNKLSVTQYFVLYNLVYPGVLTGIFSYSRNDLISLQTKGFIKITEEAVVLRELTKDIFQVKDDFFLKWLLAYPIRVKKSTGGSRVLSPRSDDTIEGRKLRMKWDKMFKGDLYAQKRALQVLELEVAMRIKANDLEFMVEAPRWLNGGFHEKYDYLIDEKTDVNSQGIVDEYEEDWG